MNIGEMKYMKCFTDSVNLNIDWEINCTIKNVHFTVEESLQSGDELRGLLNDFFSF